MPSYTKVLHHTSYPAIDPSRAELSVAGKTVFITGGGTGIGQETAKAFAQAGATSIALLGRREAPLHETKSIVEKSFPATTISIYSGDIVDAQAVETAFAAFQSQTGGQPIDIVVNNAGYLPGVTPIKSSSTADWWLGFEINVKGALNVAQAFLKHGNEAGAFVQVSTALAHAFNLPGFSSYSASKLAVAKVTEYLQLENPSARVISAHPGVVKTDMSTKSGFQTPQFDDATLPAHFFVWLTSPEAAFLKGRFAWANWDVDELKARSEEIAGGKELTLILNGAD